MMNIDVRKLNEQKTYSGRITFEYDAPQDLVSIPFVKFASPVKIDAEYELFADDALELRGKISYRLVGQCSRCLKEASVDVEGEIDALFEPKRDSEDYSYTGSVINLTEAVRDAIMASMPFGVSCGEDCEEIEYLK